MHAFFVWLFQHIFSGTPALMVSLMLLLTNFSVYSMCDSVMAPATLPPLQPTTVSMTTQHSKQSHFHQQFDHVSVKTFSVGRTASVDGNNDDGGKIRPVTGATDDD
ncbi:hypothetical protein ABZP36_015508 [Zizania latifolia]